MTQYPPTSSDRGKEGANGIGTTDEIRRVDHATVTVPIDSDPAAFFAAYASLDRYEE